MLTTSCAAKRKSTSTVSRLSEEKSEAKSQYMVERTDQLKAHLDSSYAKTWVKIYPTGNFIINEYGFSGSADSVSWYASLQKVNKKKERKGLTVTQIDSTASRYNNQKIYQQELSQKKSSKISWRILGACIIAILVLLKKHIWS